jgi:hypothetical protein
VRWRERMLLVRSQVYWRKEIHQPERVLAKLTGELTS